MIPKVIHYCWFGGGEKPEIAKKCINSWKKRCPGYQIIEWNENNLDFSKMPDYVLQAYEKKKWGFVPDYIRLWIIYNYGGIYLDTDVEVIRSFNALLELDGFAGFETEEYVALGLGFGATPRNKLICQLMNSYENISFLNQDGSLNLTPAPVLNTEIFLQNGLVPNGEEQTIGGICILPPDYLNPKNFLTGRIKKTKNTYSIHHFEASWLSKEEQKIKLQRWKNGKKDYYIHMPNRVLRRILGNELYESIKRYFHRG